MGAALDDLALAQDEDLVGLADGAEAVRRWQLKASPHRWFPYSKLSFPMLNRLDDSSRLFTGAKIYERERLLACFDFLPAAFLARGRPLQLYVAYHSLFFTHNPAALTQLGWALKCHDISLRHTPHAPG